MRILTFAGSALAIVSLAVMGYRSQVESQEEKAEVVHAGGEEDHSHQILATSPVRKNVIGTQQYVCQIRSCQHIEVRALEGGYLEEINIKEGQAVKKGDSLFKILPVIYQANLSSEVAEVQRSQIEVDNAEGLLKKGYISQQEYALKQASLAKVKAKLELAKAELAFTDVRAPFDGIVDRQKKQLGSLIEAGDMLTTLSDNSLMWVYFNVPEARYLEYKAELNKAASANGDGSTSNQNDLQANGQLKIELKLANHQIFNQPGKIGAIEADFNNTTGNIAFRADFPNPEGLLRNGQTGTILIHRTIHDALVIPQRATFEILAKRYVYVVDQDNVVHQRDITIESEQDDVFVIAGGLKEDDKIILEGIRQVRDGDKAEFEFRNPEEVLKNLKFHAE
ncbi:MAG: efflux RND transporter periplasmic adaptor subunit [Planctomycetaceae bacterium]